MQFLQAGYGLTLLCDFIRSGFQAVKGAYLLSKIPYPKVTIFGGTLAKINDHYTQQAAQLASMFAHHGMAVVTGGGPGIMQAANCGASEKTIGIGVIGVDDEFNNSCTKVIKVQHFYVRKWLLMQYSVGFIIFPGGIGTADEMFELLNYLKHKRMKPYPVVLIGKDFWDPLMYWIEHRSLKEGFIKPDYLTLFTLTDDLEYAFGLIHASWLTSREHD